VMEEGFEDAVLDAGLIGAARRVEHYEMAAYGAVCEIAKVLGQTKHASLLEKTLVEERQTDEKLAELAKDINTQANEEGSEELEQGVDGQSGKTIAKNHKPAFAFVENEGAPITHSYRRQVGMSILAWIVLGFDCWVHRQQAREQGWPRGIPGHRAGNRWRGSWGLAVQHLRSPRRHGCK